MKRVWYCKNCGHWEFIGQDRADVIVGLCPECYCFMEEQFWGDKQKKPKKQRIIPIADHWYKV